ncbi:hypothetical protein MHL30_21165 [Priestia flexa]|uniref:hypothetical protein n=1 Tax=Priestia flexa TaxID=86664 RepID=UPI001EF6252F|nr:hypothetical protein [Priestia flexa]MCG7315590.1 hypothetical protein [Priestia flexa]
MAKSKNYTQSKDADVIQSNKFGMGAILSQEPTRELRDPSTGGGCGCSSACSCSCAVIPACRGCSTGCGSSTLKKAK